MYIACAAIPTISMPSLALLQHNVLPPTRQASRHPRKDVVPSADSIPEALSINKQICEAVNVTIPDCFGCAPNVSSAAFFLSSSTGVGGLTLSSGSSQTAQVTVSTLRIVVPAVTIPTTAPVAKFTGGLLLVGSCTTPQYASIKIAGGTLEYPWFGCAANNPKCCTYDYKEGGKLGLCPADYRTTASACCPT